MDKIISVDKKQELLGSLHELKIELLQSPISILDLINRLKNFNEQIVSLHLYSLTKEEKVPLYDYSYSEKEISNKEILISLIEVFEQMVKIRFKNIAYSRRNLFIKLETKKIKETYLIIP